MPAGDFELTPENVSKWIKEFLNSQSQNDNIFSPQNLGEFIGQEKAKRVTSIFVEAALKDGRPLPNTMITGAYGQGKTTLARLMANAYDSSIRMYDAAYLNKNMVERGTFIIDEIHNLAADSCDSLNILLDNNSVHIIGCSTNPGALPAAFRSRFRQIYLEPYTEAHIAAILKTVIDKKKLVIDKKTLADIAHRSRLNPRTAINYLSFMFDLATLKNTKKIDQAIVNNAFDELNINKDGYSKRDYAYLQALPADGRPVGLQYLSAVTSIDEA